MSKQSQKKIHLKVKDHSVSGEQFELLYNKEFDMLETFPQPSSDILPQYYKSDDYISHTDSKRNIFEKLYHIVKSIALKRKLKLINSFSEQGKSLLDVGCGTGDFLNVAKESGWTVSGIEPNQQARAIANKKVNGQIFDVNTLLDFESHSFDVITLWHVLEHLPELEMHFARFKELLKPNGILIIAVPNFKSHDAKTYKQHWAAFDVPRHLWHFSQTSIKTYAKNFNFSVMETKPMKFDAFYVSLLSEKYRTGKMNYLKGFWNGWVSNQKARRSGEYSSLIYILKSKKRH